jgi:hypothetical protein
MLGDVCVEVAKNAAMKVPALRERRLRRPRTSEFAGHGSLERYAFYPLRALSAASVPVAGRRVAEIGPGDHLASGLVLLAAGAASYTAIDRFPGDYSGRNAKRWYRAVRQAWPERWPNRAWPAEIEVERFPDGFPNVRTIAAPIEQADPGERFDIVCSFQVGEHVSDIRAFAAKTRELIASGGVAVHRVDFGPHGPWRKYTDPLTFLRPPDWLWQLMGSERGIPNRHRAHEFTEAFVAAGLEVRELEREPFDVVIRRNVARRFKDMPVDSLQVRAVTYLCWPGSDSGGSPPTLASL